MKNQTQNSRWWLLWFIGILVLAIGVSYVIAWGQTENLNDTITQDDTKLKNHIIEQLQKSPELNWNWIDVKVEDQIATLSGHVNTIIAKEQAEEIASETKGIRSVINQLYVVPQERPDYRIRADISDAILMDPATERYELVVLVEDQVVTLRGQVDSWVERDIAERIAKETVGTERVINQITVNYDEERSDFEILQDVRSRLKHDARIHADFIDLEVNDNTVQLKGLVSTLAEKERAKQLAWTTGVEDVVADDLRVDYLAFQDQESEMAKDVTLEESNRIENLVFQQIQENPRVSIDNINVMVNDGVVTLTGTAETLQARNSLERELENIAGIVRVKNFISVRSDDLGASDDIIQSVVDKLRENPYFREHNINVSFHEGTVYLHGNVDSVFEKDYAKELASRVKGVEEVNNQIAVGEEWQDKTDYELQADVISELWWSPYVDRDEINVRVNDGTVRLTGDVDSLHERWKAEENAYEAGAKDVENRLTIAQE